MKVYKGASLRGLRLSDGKNKNLLDVTWYKNGNEGSWITQNIPPGSEIIGLRCNINSNDSSIMRLGFVVWTPKASYSLVVY